MTEWISAFHLVVWCTVVRRKKHTHLPKMHMYERKIRIYGMLPHFHKSIDLQKMNGWYLLLILSFVIFVFHTLPLHTLCLLRLEPSLIVFHFRILLNFRWCSDFVAIFDDARWRHTSYAFHIQHSINPLIMFHTFRFDTINKFCSSFLYIFHACKSSQMLSFMPVNIIWPVKLWKLS